jgi:hypothetical protein
MVAKTPPHPPHTPIFNSAAQLYPTKTQNQRIISFRFAYIIIYFLFKAEKK